MFIGSRTIEVNPSTALWKLINISQKSPSKSVCLLKGRRGNADRTVGLIQIHAGICTSYMYSRTHHVMFSLTVRLT